MPNVLLILVQTSISLSQQRHRKYYLDPQIQLPDTATRSRNQNAKCASYLRLEICYNHGNRMRYVLPIRGLTYAIITETECLKCFLSEPEEYHNHGTGMPKCFLTETVVCQNQGTGMLTALPIQD